MTLTPARPEDLSAVIALTARVVAAMRAAGIEQWDDVYPDAATFAADIAAGHLYLRCTPEGALAGCVCRNAEQSPEYAAVPWTLGAGPIAVLHRLMVDPDVQGRGHARAILEAAEAHAWAAGARTMRLDAFVHNPAALRLYEAAGYRRAGTVLFRKGPFHCYEKSLA